MAYKLIQNFTKVNFTKGNSGRKYIVIHYTGNKTDKATSNGNYFKNENRGSSAHYFVDDTTVVQVVSEDDTAWAVGRNYGSNNLFGKCTNSNSISIEMCSTDGRISNATYQNTVALVKSLMKKYNIDAAHVVRHWDVCSKSCPGWTGWGANGKDASIWNQFKKDISATAGWVKDSTGWWWKESDGSYPKSSWKKIAGVFYWFNEKGYCVMNDWILYQKHFYFLGETGDMTTGWKKIGEDWYYFDQTGGKLPIGAMLTGWQMIGGKYFYFYPKRAGKHAEGAMLTGELLAYDGHDYRCWSAGEDKKKQTGEMVTGWYKDGKSGKYYWYNTIATKDMPLGAMYKNKWLKLPEAWYYFKDYGEMACDETLVIGGKKYMFGKNGYMQ